MDPNAGEVVEAALAGALLPLRTEVVDVLVPLPEDGIRIATDGELMTPGPPPTDDPEIIP